MIPGYKKFQPGPPATSATPATKPMPTRNEVAKVAEVAASGGSKTWDYQIRDWAPERAAIMEYDGGLSRAEAERRAYGGSN